MSAADPDLVDVSRRYRNDLNLLLGRTCNATCAHCSISSSPQNRLRMGPATVDRLIPLIAAFACWPQARRVVFTGGEPFLFRKQMAPLARAARERGLLVGVETNAYWSRNRQAADRIIRDFDIDDYLISTSLFHREFVPVESVLTAYESALALGKSAIVRICVENVDQLPSETDLLREVGKRVAASDIVLQSVLPFGHRVANAPADAPMPAAAPDDPLKCPTDGPIVLDNGRVDPCCNSLNALADHGLVIGSAADAPDDLLRVMDHDPLFAFIREKGLRDLFARLASLGHVDSSEALPADPCVACARIFADAKLRGVLGELRSGRLALDAP